MHWSSTLHCKVKLELTAYIKYNLQKPCKQYLGQKHTSNKCSLIFFHVGFIWYHFQENIIINDSKMSCYNN